MRIEKLIEKLKEFPGHWELWVELPRPEGASSLIAAGDITGIMPHPDHQAVICMGSLRAFASDLPEDIP
jgi:hypothetical protein